MTDYNSSFPELAASSVESLPCANVKASPSVNSPNDGSFNSEENLKWGNRKLSQKPFIVGKTPEDVRKQFVIADNDGDSVQISGGMLSYDGYLFNINSTETISYDKSTSDYFIPFNTQNVVKFVENLTNRSLTNSGAIKSSRLSSDLNSMLFSEFRTDINPEDMYNTTWQTAAVNNQILGYVKETYSSEFTDCLTITFSGHVPQYVEYEDIYISAILNNSGISSIEEIKTMGIFGKPFALLSSQQGLHITDIYYPINIETKKVLQNGEYIDKYFLTYTDIFSINHILSVNTVRSRTYPNTQSLVCDITENKPLDTIGFSETKKLTYPYYIYDFSKLYYDDEQSSEVVPYKRYSANGPLSTDIEYQNLRQLSVPIGNKQFGMFNDLFDIYNNYYLLTNMRPSTDTLITSVQTDLSYFCLKEVGNSDKLTITNSFGNTVYIPVAFMTSDGRLCPNGFIYKPTGSEEYTTISTYPVEGYLHWIKRLYLKYVQNNVQPTEQEINSVTVSDLISWTSGTSTFLEKYSILFKYISMYLQISYSALLDNVVFNTEGSSDNDYLNINFNGCGVKIPQGQYVTKDDFYAYQTYEYNDGLSDTQVNVSYHKDIDSDFSRHTDCVCPISEGKYAIKNSVVTDGKYYTYYGKPKNTVTYQGTTFDVTMLGIDDPVNYIKRCIPYITSVGESYPGDIIEDYSGQLKLYKIQIDQNVASLVPCEVCLSDIRSASYLSVINTLAIDEYLVPVKVPDNYPTANSLKETNLNTWLDVKVQNTPGVSERVSSMINGLNFCWNSYCWDISIPLVTELNYDALGYLRGVNIENTSEYKGLRFFFRLDVDLTPKDFVLFDMILSNIQTNENFDKESCIIKDSTLFKESNEQRESYIHSSKIFDLDINSITNINSMNGCVPVLVGCQSLMWGDFNDTEQEDLVTGIKSQDNSFFARFFGSSTWERSYYFQSTYYVNVPNTYKLVPFIIQTEKCIKLDNSEDYTINNNSIALSPETPHFCVYPGSIRIKDNNNNVYTDNGIEYVLFDNTSEPTADIVDSNNDAVGTINYKTRQIVFNDTIPSIQKITFTKAIVTKKQSDSSLSFYNIEQSQQFFAPWIQYNVRWDVKNTQPVMHFSTYEQMISMDPSLLEEGQIGLIKVTVDEVTEYNWYVFNTSSGWTSVSIPQNVYSTLLVFAINERMLPSYIVDWNTSYDPIS